MVIYLTLKKLRFSSQAICHVNSMISKENPKDSLCFKNVRLATLCFKPQYIVAKNVLKVDKLCFKNGQVLVNGTVPAGTAKAYCSGTTWYCRSALRKRWQMT